MLFSSSMNARGDRLRTQGESSRRSTQVEDEACLLPVIQGRNSGRANTQRRRPERRRALVRPGPLSPANCGTWNMAEKRVRRHGGWASASVWSSRSRFS